LFADNFGASAVPASVPVIPRPALFPWPVNDFDQDRGIRAFERPPRSCYIGGYVATETQVSVRELKNQTTRILRRVEAGEHITVTRRGKPVATIEPSIQVSLPASDSVYRSLQRQIDARIPGLRQESEATARRDFERISRKIAKTIPYKDWREMDRVAKGDRFGLSRQ
jgi:prevent-host-death family protein